MKIETLIELLGAMAKVYPGCNVLLEDDGYQYRATGISTEENGEGIWVVVIR